MLLYSLLLPSVFIRLHTSFLVLSILPFIYPSFPFVYLIECAHFPSFLLSFIVFLAVYIFFTSFILHFFCLYFISSLPFIFLPLQ